MPPSLKRKPTHRLRVLDKESGRSNTVGAAWLNADGHLTINLDVGVSLTWDRNVTITLWPVDENEEPYWKKQSTYENVDPPLKKKPL